MALPFQQTLPQPTISGMGKGPSIACNATFHQGRKETKRNHVFNWSLTLQSSFRCVIFFWPNVILFGIFVGEVNTYPTSPQPLGLINEYGPERPRTRKVLFGWLVSSIKMFRKMGKSVEISRYFFPEKMPGCTELPNLRNPGS